MAFSLCICVAWPAQAFAQALVRFIHAVPGVGKATVAVSLGSGERNLGSIGFGQVTRFSRLPSGAFHWSLTGSGKVLAKGTSRVGSGVYDIVILDKKAGSGVDFAVYQAAGAKKGTSLLRVIHAVPELGAPMIMLDSHTMADRLPYVHATPYFSIKPGVHSISAMKPSEMKPGDPTLLDVKGVQFAPGVAYTAIAIGSRGQKVRAVAVVDRGVPPARTARFVKAVKPGAMRGSSMRAAGSIVVHRGDSLWLIARRLLGPAASNEQVAHKLVDIWNMNAKRIGTGNPNLIYAGTRLMLHP